MKARATPRPQPLAALLFSQGFGTRRDCVGRVLAGTVAVGGVVHDDPDELFPPEGVVITVDGVDWPVHERAVVLLHKPAGYECSTRPCHHPGVLSLLPAPLRTRGVQPVGRLDADTTGALLLTDDGALIHRLTSPRHEVPKVYEVTTRHPVDARQCEALVAGVVLDDDPAPVRAVEARPMSERALRLVLTQGRYHQVKRMLAAVGNRVEALHRSAIGELVLGPDLPVGRWRWVTPQEIGGGASR
jgi:16S rRNA pseudouridine516 synthase